MVLKFFGFNFDMQVPGWPFPQDKDDKVAALVHASRRTFPLATSVS